MPDRREQRAPVVDEDGVAREAAHLTVQQHHRRPQRPEVARELGAAVVGRRQHERVDAASHQHLE